MIEFEGFELKNSEDNIIFKQPGTQPMVLKSFMKMLGAKEGSSSTKRYDWQTDEQKDLFGNVLSGYQDLEYQGPGEFTKGKDADELAGFKATSFDQLRKLKEEGRLSLEGLNKLRNYGATAATQVNPDIEALRSLGDESNISFDRRLAETTSQARKKLQESDIASRRGAGGTGGTALTRGIAAGIGDYGKTVGDAHARAVEEADYRNRQLAMQSRMQAGQLGLGATQQGLQGLNIAQSGELGQLSLDAQDLSQRRSIHSQERQYQGQNELQRARYSAERADAQNLWNMTGAQNKNQFALDRLRGATDASTRRTFEDVVTKTKGTAGFGGTLLKTAGTVGGAYVGSMYGNPMLGAQIGGQLGEGIVSNSGDWGGSGSVGRGGGGYGNVLNAGLDAYYNKGTTGGTGGTYNPRVPPRANNSYNSYNSGYGGDYGEFGGDMAGSYGRSGIDPSLTMMNDDPNLWSRRQFGGPIDDWSTGGRPWGRQTFNPADNPYLEQYGRIGPYVSYNQRR